MNIQNTQERARLAPDQPKLHQPVNARMNCVVYYQTERGPVIWNNAFYCERIFAETVLQTLDGIMADIDKALVHIGCFNPRLARSANGNVILPRRWSNHAYGLALDFKGICNDPANYIEPKYTPYRIMDIKHKNLIKERCKTAILRIGKKPEVVDEHDWLHIGIWPEK